MNRIFFTMGTGYVSRR